MFLLWLLGQVTFWERGAYQAQSMEMPRRRKMEYSSHEKRGVCFLW